MNKLFVIIRRSNQSLILAPCFIDGELFVEPVSHTVYAARRNLKLYMERYPDDVFLIGRYDWGHWEEV